MSRCAAVAAGILLLAAAPATAQQMSFEWRGRDGDGVGRDGARAPDGGFDHHFRLTVTLDRPTEVRAIAISYGDAEGGAPEPVWSSADSTLELLGIDVDGAPVNTGYALSQGRFDGEVVFDLYATDLGELEVGSHVTVAVTLGGDRTLRRTIALQPPPGRLVGSWSVHCQSRSPEAFEPMTMSGRLFLDIGDDGRITGAIDQTPVTGQLEGTAARGAGVSETDRFTWKGELTRSGRGRWEGSGFLTLDRTGESCGSGPWRSD